MDLLGFIGVADRNEDNSSERQGQSVSPRSVHFFDGVDQKKPRPVLSVANAAVNQLC
jgi:hypothetical protein